MRYLQVFTAAGAVVICLFLTVTEVKGLKYSNTGELKKAVIDRCCVQKEGKRENLELIPMKKSSEAKEFLTRLTKRGLFEECCRESCDNEEAREGAGNIDTPQDLGEECMVEGCSIEELDEHC